MIRRSTKNFTEVAVGEQFKSTRDNLIALTLGDVAPPCYTADAMIVSFDGKDAV